MSNDDHDSEDNSGGGQAIANEVDAEIAAAPGRSSPPVFVRLAHEIPKPKDWQSFQRACVVLYREELSDPHTQEYGRSGQDQRGIDILGRRDCNPNHPVAVQCRKVENPLKKAKIESDCRRALELEPGLKEIIFATTAQDDTHATDAAKEVENALVSDGFAVRIVIYGWGQLQTVIALHEVAYNVFQPSSVSTSQHVSEIAPQVPSASEIAKAVAAELRNGSLGLRPSEPDRDNWDLEDPALHARIDIYRDLFKNDHQAIPARNGLRDLLPRATDEKPWARFRIETTLGSIAMELGGEQEAIDHFEAAYAARPDDPNALANLALARTMAERFDEAMEFGRRAIEASPPAEAGLAYLLQAVARSDWEGDPYALIPDELRDTLAADLGLAEFFRRKEIDGWPQRVIEFAEKHPDAEELQRLKSGAVLELALQRDGSMVGGLGNVDITMIAETAEFMLQLTNRYLDQGFSDRDDLAAYLNNTAILLRLAGRQAECEALLKRGIPLAAESPMLRRILALSIVAQDRMEDAAAVLKHDNDAESQLLLTEFTGLQDPRAALAIAEAIVVPDGSERLQFMRQRAIAELAIRLNERELVERAADELRKLANGDLTADLLLLQLAVKYGEDEETVQARLLELAKRVNENTPFLTRYELAETLADEDLPSKAADLLAGYVDLSRNLPPTRLYLRSVAAARRDAEFVRLLREADVSVREDPGVLWGTAAHYWNIGDLPKAEATLERLLELEPKYAKAHLLRLEIYIRSDRTGALLNALEGPLETLDFQLEDGLRLSRLLAHFGKIDRGAALAYRLFLTHRDLSPAWMALSSIVLWEGRDVGEARWTIGEVALDAAVDLEFEDGEKRLFVVESDTELRRIDPDSVEPDHLLIKLFWGKKQGDEFETVDGRKGRIAAIRHKFVARFHYILEHHGDRFPDVAGFKRVTFNPDDPNPFESVTELAKSRREWIDEEQERWSKTAQPLALFARRMGADVIEVAQSVVQSGYKLKVADGNEPERALALQAIAANYKAGCTLDLLTFWTAWRLKSLDTIVAMCGKIHIPQSVMDSLRARRERFDEHSKEGLKTAGFDDGRLVVQEAAPEFMGEMRNDTHDAIRWLEANAEICPLVASENLPEEVRDHVRSAPTGILDSALIAFQTKTLLLSDDQFTRAYHGQFAGNVSAWTHIVLYAAYDRKLIALDDYVDLTANLVEAGHSYVGVTGEALAAAAGLDAADGGAPGYRFKQLASTIGGPTAERISHLRAVAEALDILWGDMDAIAYRQSVSGHLIRSLLRGRSDYLEILRALMIVTRRHGYIREYILGWMRGHFIPMDAVEGRQEPAQKRRGRRS